MPKRYKQFRGYPENMYTSHGGAGVQPEMSQNVTNFTNGGGPAACVTWKLVTKLAAKRPKFHKFYTFSPVKWWFFQPKSKIFCLKTINSFCYFFTITKIKIFLSRIFLKVFFENFSEFLQFFSEFCDFSSEISRFFFEISAFFFPKFCWFFILFHLYNRDFFIGFVKRKWRFYNFISEIE